MDQTTAKERAEKSLSELMDNICKRLDKRVHEPFLFGYDVEYWDAKLYLTDGERNVSYNTDVIALSNIKQFELNMMFYTMITTWESMYGEETGKELSDIWKETEEDND